MILTASNAPAPPPVLRGRTLAEQLRATFFAFGVIVVVASCFTVLAYGVSWAWLTPERERNQAAVSAASSAFAAMLDDESALRGYVMTHDPRFLERGAAADTRLDAANERLTTSIGGSSVAPDAALAMIDMRLAAERWRNQWAVHAADAQTVAIAPSMSDGMALFDDYRRQEAVFSDSLRARSELLHAREKRMTAGCVVIQLLVFVAVLLLAVWQHRAQRRAFVLPIAALLRHVRGIRDGEIAAPTDPAAPREVAELGEGLDEVVRAVSAARDLAALHEQALGDQSARLRQILEASREFAESLNLKYVVGAVRASTAEVGGYESVIVWLMSDEQKQLVVSDDGGETPRESSVLPLGHGLAGRAAKSGRITFEAASGQIRFADSNVGVVRAIAIPLIVGARVVGVLEARHDEPAIATRDVIEVLEMLATHAATAIESARLHEVIAERSHMDALTRLYNRRRLDEDIEAECQRCLRYGRPLAFVMLDVDHFKAYNDAHGHPQADVALQEVAGVISSCVRTTDTAYRYGGEEFCVILRETSAPEGILFAERVRARIEQRFAKESGAGITASFGVAEFSTDGPTPRALIVAADAAMYDSKHGGRNRVSRSSVPSVDGHAQIVAIPPPPPMMPFG